MGGASAGAEIRVDGDVLIGRSEDAEQATAADPMLSRRHARIRCTEEGTLVVEDLGSTNGTYVNEERIAGPRELRPGDVLRVGGTTLEVREAPPEIDTGTQLATAELSLPVEQVGSPSAMFPVQRAAEAPPPPARVVYRDHPLPISPAGLTIGRLEDNDLVVATEQASRRHARIIASEGRYYVVDLGSRNGTHLNGERLLGGARWLNSGDAIAVGGESIRFLIGEDAGDARAPAPGGPGMIRFDGARLTIGRDPTSSVHLDDPSISRFHAEVVAAGGRVELRDLGSRNGTRVNGDFVTSAVLRAGSEVGIGPFRLVFDGTSFVQRDDRGALRLDAYDVSIRVRDRPLLNRASLSVDPGEFVAVIGESGSGKTTFVKALAGVTSPGGGEILVNGEAVASHLTSIGYVPQDDIVHARLTVQESLEYSARLRLPQDSSEQDVQQAVARVLQEVSLTHRAGNRVGSLSGGERKRVSLATELLNRPGLLFLDEPTTGLDPGLESRMMELFRSLAAVGRHALVVVTHATKNLDLVDKLCVMGRGGELCFVGSPHAAKRFFAVGSYDEIYGALDRRPAVEWRRDFEVRQPQTPAEPRAPRPVVRRRPVPARAIGPQAAILVERYLKLFLRDRRSVLFLLLQVPLIALVIGLLFQEGALRGPGLGIPASAAQLLFVLVMTMTWLGTLDSAREVIKERAILGRERAVGVALRAYLASKVAVLYALVAVQATILLLVVLALRSLDDSVGAHLALLLALILTGFAAVSMGLLISSIVATEEQATALIPASMIVQLLFGGAIVTVKNMGSVIAAVSATAFSRWAYAGVGGIVHMNDRIAADRDFSRRNPYGLSFFDLPPPVTYVILIGFVLAFLSLAAVALHRRSR